LFDEAEFVRLATTHRNVLRTIVLKHLNSRYLSDVDDVIQHGLTCTWENRFAVTSNTGGYLCMVLSRTAMSWRREHRERELDADAPGHYDLADTETPESVLLRAESDAELSGKWQGLRSKLEPRHLASLEDWEQRGYRDHNHAQEIRTSRMRTQLGELGGHSLRHLSLSVRKRRARA
jgi:hypothetical protein